MRLIVVLLIAVAALSACSSGSPQAARSTDGVVDGITIPPPYVKPAGTVVPGPTSCPSDFATILGSGYAQTSQSASHLLTCTYQGSGAPCTKAVVIVNTEPQAYMAFDRWNVETGQNSMWTSNPALRPTPIAGIGIEAEWVPALLELGTGNDTTWVSVTLTGGGDTPEVLALAESLARAGLASSA